ncbi:biogenesis of lysosome-related organelles complex 1 subunit 5 [Echinops telfairi]|uniref:Biogenesis of lysosome-related organelles complex 1 subunit 5 n=1 Tax=Echinops telfairi TaxID=9371 RepID=A0AC55D8W9_ECHTE|nr:biogenesis of lysosome-related organelles complex 1 subunit 5 [Echinops telfairi]
MSGGGAETPGDGEAATGGGGVKKRDSVGIPGSPAHLIIKDPDVCFIAVQAVNHSVYRLQQMEQEQRKIRNEHIPASEKQRVTQWEAFMREQHNKQAGVDEKHRKAMERLKEQYAEMEKDLAKYSTF